MTNTNEDENIILEKEIDPETAGLESSSSEISASGEKGMNGEDLASNNSYATRLSKSVARQPWKYLIGSFSFAVIFSVIGLVGGDFAIEVENQGWRSRGTTIADRTIQIDLIEVNQDELFYDTDGSKWDYLVNNRKKGWDWVDRRRLSSDASVASTNDKASSRNLLEDECLDWYSTPQIVYNDNLVAAWKTGPGVNALDNKAILQICKAEENTLALMEQLGVCETCNGECLPPQSLVLALREYLDAFDETCDELAALYTIQEQTAFTIVVAQCVEEAKSRYDPVEGDFVGNSTSTCQTSFPFGISFVDKDFGTSNIQMSYTSSYFPTITSDENLKQLYANVDGLDRGEDKAIIDAAYDTRYEYMGEAKADELVTSDMLLAVASFFITAIAIVVHTRSVWLTIIGIFQIILSFPLAYFVYHFIARLSFFPFLNFIGVFVVTALGADDIFVAVDKWKNARLAAPNATTEEVAAKALPDAAGAMLLTTSSTAVAFFATAICPVAPILCFAVFCGLLITLDYMLNIILLFPALCIYDNWLMTGKSNCLIAFGQRKPDFTAPAEDEQNFTGGAIHKIIGGYYDILHKLRWPIFILSIGATILCGVFASNLSLPEDSEVRLLRESNQFEQNYMRKRNLLYTDIILNSGSNVKITWGLKSGDNGNKNNPESLSSLFLDKAFDPTSEDAQIYLRDVCDRLYENDFALLPNRSYKCPMNRFDEWLAQQASLPIDEQDFEYTNNCESSTGLPMSSDSFEPCLISWTELAGDMNILENKGKIQVITIEAQSTARFTDPYNELRDEYENYENWLQNERKNVAPAGVNRVFHGSETFWWYDTNGSMFQTAIGAAAIAIAFSTFIVFISAKSFSLTLFSTVTICYVLLATTASIVGLGWDLGFLESICFAILIGISCDFVIHIGHAYSHFDGSVSREERSKYAIIHMGPSILAAAATTFAAAMLMLFCQLTFFTKFATILFMTILHSTIGTFVVFLVMADLFGPSEPTKLVDGWVARVTGKKKQSDSVDS